MNVPDRINLAELQLEYAGLWVALRGTTVIEARRSPYELVQALRERGLKGSIVRVPDNDELETVGIG